MKALNYRMKLSKVVLSSADEQKKPVIEDVVKKNGRYANMYIYLNKSPELLKSYLYGYERCRNESGFTAAEQEVILPTVSYEK